jgi:two-component system CheB/CheR fusion protein
MVSLHVRRIRGDDEAPGLFLVLFEKEDGAPPEEVLASPSLDAAADLDKEVRVLKDQLANTVENYEAANEELKASNEELQAMNEEMRSAAEELETSKEELQSVNEELTTVNAELKTSVEDLSRANSDLNSLMASTNVATIFLNRELQVERFTARVKRIFNLIAADIGRRLSDITHKVSYPDLIPDAQRVLDELVTTEREVQLENGSWMLARIAPYRTSDDRIAGVVVTFVDVTEQRQTQEQLRDHIKELERFNRLAVGRELRMVELKKEINALLARAGEPPRYKIEPEDPPPQSADAES